MNIIDIIKGKTSLKLSDNQLSQCGERCFGYISPNDIGITTCGTRIHSDNVFPQKDKVSMRVEGELVKVIGRIDDQEVIGLTSKSLIEPHFSNCEKRFEKFHDDKVVYYMGCKHIKFILKNEDILIGS